MGKTDDIADLVTNAMGNSVTPSRLQQSKDPGLVRRLVGNEAVPGPFTDDLGSNEQPHYLFHTTNRIEVPDDQAEGGLLSSLTPLNLYTTVEMPDQAGGLSSILDWSAFTPGSLIVTDTHLLLIYNRDSDRIVRRFEYPSIEEVRHQQMPIQQSLEFVLGEDVFTFAMWNGEDYSEELTDAAAYISDKSDVEYTGSEYDFQGQQFDDAATVLRDQLNQISATAQSIDVKFVLKYAKEGAKKGTNPKTIGLGFLLGAGYGIWADIKRESEIDASTGLETDELTFNPDQIDPDATAKEMLRWKQLGDRISEGKGGLAGAAIGASVAIDQQVNDRSSVSVLAELNLEEVGQQLEDGEVKEGGLEITSQVLDSYSEGLGTLLADDFFRQIWRTDA